MVAHGVAEDEETITHTKQKHLFGASWSLAGLELLKQVAHLPQFRELFFLPSFFFVLSFFLYLGLMPKCREILGKSGMARKKIIQSQSDEVKADEPEPEPEPEPESQPEQEPEPESQPEQEPEPESQPEPEPEPETEPETQPETQPEPEKFRDWNNMKEFYQENDVNQSDSSASNTDYGHWDSDDPRLDPIEVCDFF